jgi:hypothetical protein
MMSALEAFSPTARALLRHSPKPARKCPFGDIPKGRADVFTAVAHRKERLFATDRATPDVVKFKRLQAMIGNLVMTLGGSINTANKRQMVVAIGAHCVGWIESKGVLPVGRKGNVFDQIHQERVYQRQLFLDGKIAWDVSNTTVDDDLKLLTIGEEVGEVAEAVETLMLAKRALRQSKCTVHLCCELTQVAAVAVAWLESMEGR